MGHKKLTKRLIALFIITIASMLIIACNNSPKIQEGSNVEKGNENNNIQTKETYENIVEARNVQGGELLIIEPVRISQEHFLFTEGTLEWEGTDYYLMVVYDQYSQLMVVEVDRANVVDDVELQIGDFLRIEGQWLESQNENAKIMVVEKVEIIEPIENWDARPGDM